MGDRAAAAGVQSTVHKRRGRKAGKVDEDGDSSLRAERSFDAEGFVAGFAHPTVVQGYTALLATFRSASPRLLHYIIHFLRRLEALPNDVAGTDPRTGKALTWEPLLHHWSVVEVAASLLNDR